MVPFIIGPLLASILTVGVLKVIEHWDEVKKFFKKLIADIQEVFRKVKFYVQNASKIFLRKIREGWAEFKQEQYYKENEKWFKKTTTVEIQENEVPAWAKVKMRQNARADVTENMEEELEMRIA